MLNAIHTWVVSAVIVNSLSLSAGVFYVDVNSPNVPGTGSFFDPYRSIGQAVNSPDINDGDIVVINPGRYTGPNNTDVSIPPVSLILKSIDPNDPSVVSSTIIDPNHQGRGFVITNHPGWVEFKGLTITDANSSVSGGAFFCYKSTVTLEKCHLQDNQCASSGGALYAFDCDIAITNSLLINNRGNFGGAVRVASDSNLTMTNCTLAANKALSMQGDGIYCNNSNLIAANSIFWKNGKENLYAGDSNASVAYSVIDANWPGTGNLKADPCFVSFDINDPSDNWDFHLQSQAGRWNAADKSWGADANTSRGIDAGDPNGSYHYELWPHGKHINIGAYGNTSQASMSLDPAGNSADLNKDDIVDANDLSMFTDEWLEKDRPLPADLDRNSAVNFRDYSIFSDNWLWRQPDAADLDQDGTVNFCDYSILTKYWLSTHPPAGDLYADDIVDYKDIRVFVSSWLD